MFALVLCCIQYWLLILTAKQKEGTDIEIKFILWQMSLSRSCSYPFLHNNKVLNYIFECQLCPEDSFILRELNHKSLQFVLWKLKNKKHAQLQGNWAPVDLKRWASPHLPSEAWKSHRLCSQCVAVEQRAKEHDTAIVVCTDIGRVIASLRCKKEKKSK